jgi:MFS family permease
LRNKNLSQLSFFVGSLLHRNNNNFYYEISGERVSNIAKSLLAIIDAYKKVAVNRNIMVLSITVFLVFGASLSWLFVFPLYLRHLGAQEMDIGLSYLLINTAVYLLSFPGGFLSDRIGRVKMIVIPTYIVPFLYLSAAFTNNWLTAAISVAVANLFVGMQLPALFSIYAESVEDNQRGHSFGMLSISAAASAAVGPGLGSFFSSTVDQIRGVIIFCAAITFICAVIRQFTLTDTNRHDTFNVTFKQVIKSFDRNIIIFLFALTFFALMFNTTYYGPFVTLYSKDIIKLPAETIQRMIMLGGVFSVISSVDTLPINMVQETQCLLV